MPLLHGKFFQKNQLINLKKDDEVFFLDVTKEIFINYEEYLDQLVLANSFVWTCGYTGKQELNFEEALQSENKAKESLKSFPESIIKPILYAASCYKTKNFNELLNFVLKTIDSRYFISEVVLITTNKSEEITTATIKNVILPNSKDKIILPSKLEYTCTVKNKVYVLTSDKLQRELNLNEEVVRGILMLHLYQNSELFSIKDEFIKKYKLDHCRWANYFLGLSQPFTPTSDNNFKKIKSQTKIDSNSKNCNFENPLHIKLFKDDFGFLVSVIEFLNRCQSYLDLKDTLNLESFINILLDTKFDGKFIHLLNKLFRKIMQLDNSCLKEKILNSLHVHQLLNIEAINSANMKDFNSTIFNTWTITSFLFIYIQNKSNAYNNENFISKQCYQFKTNNTGIFSLLQNGHVLELLPSDRLALITFLSQILLSFDSIINFINSERKEDIKGTLNNSPHNNFLHSINIYPIGIDSCNNKYFLLPSIDGLFIEFSINLIHTPIPSLENVISFKTKFDEENNSSSFDNNNLEVNENMVNHIHSNTIIPESCSKENMICKKWAFIPKENILESWLDKLAIENELNGILYDTILNCMDKILITMNNCNKDLLSLPHTINDLVINNWKLDESNISTDLPKYSKKMPNFITITNNSNGIIINNDDHLGFSGKNDSIVDSVKNESAIIGFRDATLKKCVTVMRKEMHQLHEQLTLNGLSELNLDESQHWLDRLTLTKNLSFVEAYNILKEFMMLLLNSIEIKHISSPLNDNIENFKSFVLKDVPSILHLFLPLRIFGLSVAWHKSALNANCIVCKLGSQQMDYLLLCDKCDSGLHLKCHNPPLDTLPDIWLCDKCNKIDALDNEPMEVDTITGENMNPLIQFYDLPCEDIGEFSDSDDNLNLDETLSTSTCNISLIQSPNDSIKNIIKPPIPKKSKKILVNNDNDSSSSEKKSKRNTGEALKINTTPNKIESKNNKNEQNQLSAKSVSPKSSEIKRSKKQKILDENTINSNDGKDINVDSNISNSKTTIHEKSKYVETFYENADGIPKRKYLVPKSTFRSSASFQKAVENLVSEIMKNDNVWPFLTPVTAKVAPDYHEIVKHPMDLSTIKYKIYQVQYSNPNDIISDIRLMFDNCFLYNPRGTVVRKAGENLEKYFEKRLKEIEKEDSAVVSNTDKIKK